MGSKVLDTTLEPIVRKEKKYMRFDIPLDDKLRNTLMAIKFHSRSSVAKIVTKAVTQFCDAYMEDHNIKINEKGNIEERHAEQTINESEKIVR
jgi:hypothetical protein